MQSWGGACIYICVWTSSASGGMGLLSTISCALSTCVQSSHTCAIVYASYTCVCGSQMCIYVAPVYVRILVHPRCWMRGEACASLCFRGDLCRPSSSKLLPQNSIRGVVHSFIMPSAVLSNPSTCSSMRVSLAQSLSVEEPSHGILRGEVEVLGRTPSGCHTYFCTGTLFSRVWKACNATVL